METFLTVQDTLESLLHPDDVMSSGSAPSPGLVLAVAGIAAILLGLLFAWTVTRVFGSGGGNPQERADFGVGAADCLMLALLFFGTLYIGNEIAKYFLGFTPPLSSYSLEERHLFSLVARPFGLLTVVAFLAMRASGGKFDKVRFSPLEARRLVLLPLLVLIWVPLGLAVSWANGALQLLVWDHIQMQAVLDEVSHPTKWRTWSAIVSAVIVAPIVEEFVFRVGIQGFLRRYMGFWYAALIPLAVFVLCHDVLDQPFIILPIAVLGLALAWVYERTGNVWHAIFLHATHNGILLMLVIGTQNWA